MMRLCEIITIQYLALKYITIPIYRNAEDRLEWLFLGSVALEHAVTPGLQGIVSNFNTSKNINLRAKKMICPIHPPRLDSFIETNTS
jgi:hypothetical protein